MIDTSNTNTAFTEREQVEMLLPWYATGTLDADERALVDAYLERNPDMRQQLDLIQQERREVTLENEAVGLPRAAALDDLMASVRKETPAPVSRAFPSLIDTVRDFFRAPSSAGVRFVAVAAAVLVVVQAVAIGTLVNQPSAPPTYTTASGEKNGTVSAPGTYALVQFKGSARVSEVATALTELNLQIVGGPKPGGLYRVRIADKVLAGLDKDARFTTLRNRNDIFTLVTRSR